MKEGVKARACRWLVPFSSQLHPHLQYKGYFKERSFPFWVFNATRKTLLFFELGTPGMCHQQRLERLRRMYTFRWTYSPVFFITQHLRLPRFTLVPKHYSLRTVGSFLSPSTVPAAKLGVNIDYLLSQFPKTP